MEFASGIITNICGLIAIFTFVTGARTLRELKQESKQRGTPVAQTKGPSRTRLVILAPVFAISLVPFAWGMAGSDTGGTAGILIVAAGMSAFVYSKWLHQSIPLSAFSIAMVIILALSGYGCGTISRGEEVAGLVTGFVSGIGAGLIAMLLGR